MRITNAPVTPAGTDIWMPGTPAVVVAGTTLVCVYRVTVPVMPLREVVG